MSENPLIARKLFPAEAGPTDGVRSPGGTGFSRECIGGYTANVMAIKRASSRLKPVLHRLHPGSSTLCIAFDQKVLAHQAVPLHFFI